MANKIDTLKSDIAEMEEVFNDSSTPADVKKALEPAIKKAKEELAEIEKKSEDKKPSATPKKSKGYKLGDMYSSDFDDEGMLEMALTTNKSWSKKDLRKLFDSFEDVNYHTPSQPLWDAINNSKNDKEVEENLKKFHKLVKDELGEVEEVVVKKEEPKKKKESTSALQKCKDLLEKYQEKKKNDAKRLKKRAEQGKPIELTPAETVKKSAKKVEAKIINMVERTGGLKASEINQLASGIIETIKSTLEGITDTTKKHRFLKEIGKEIHDLEKHLPKAAANGMYMEDGGTIADSNKEMILSNIHSIKHHADEISEILKQSVQVEAWVNAKAERAATDLSDITHYLDGELHKYEKGGEINKLVGQIFRPFNSHNEDNWVTIIYADFENIEYSDDKGEIHKAKTKDFLDSYINVSSHYAKGGSLSHYNTGRSWHLDRARHNSREAWENKGMFEQGGRIEEMVEHWNRCGWAGSHINNDDSEFFEKIGKSYSEVPTASFTGNDIKYYDDSRVDVTTGGFKQKFETGGTTDCGCGKSKYEHGGEIYAIAEKMTDEEYNEEYKKLDKKRQDKVNILIRLGDSPKLALSTVLYGNYSINENSDTWKLYSYAKGGYISTEEYRDKLEGMTDNELLAAYCDEYGFDIEEDDHKERIEEERDMVIDDMVERYQRSMKSSGRMAKGGEVGDSFLHLYKLTYPDGFYIVESYDGEFMSPREAMLKMRINVKNFKSYKYKGVSSQNPKYKEWKDKKDIGYSDTEAWEEVFENDKFEQGGEMYDKGGEVDYEYDAIAYAKTKGKESVNWDKELREYAGSQYSKLTSREKEEIISDMQRNWYSSHSYAKGGKVSRSQKQYNKDVDAYKYFIVDLKNKKAVSGWEFRNDANEALNDYDGDKNYKVLAEVTLKSMGIENPKERFKQMAKGGEIDYNLEQLKKRYVDVYLMGVSEPFEDKIKDVYITPKNYNHRDIKLTFENGSVSIFPLSKLDDFLKGDNVKVKGEKEPYIIKLVKNREDKNFIENIREKGGKVGFKDKVKAISKRLEGTKVNPKYQKTYGKTYDKSESVEAATKIAGSQVAKYKMAKGGTLKEYVVSYKKDKNQKVALGFEKVKASSEKEAIKKAKDKYNNEWYEGQSKGKEYTKDFYWYI